MEPVNLRKTDQALAYLSESEFVTRRRVKELQTTHQRELERIAAKNAAAAAEAKQRTDAVQHLNDRLTQAALAAGVNAAQPWAGDAVPSHGDIEEKLKGTSQRWQAVHFIEQAEALSRSTPRGSTASRWRLTVLIAAGVLLIAPAVGLFL